MIVFPAATFTFLFVFCVKNFLERLNFHQKIFFRERERERERERDFNFQFIPRYEYFITETKEMKMIPYLSKVGFKQIELFMQIEM